MSPSIVVVVVVVVIKGNLLIQSLPSTFVARFLRGRPIDQSNQLLLRVFEARRAEIARKEAAVRSSAVGSGDRSERIRTYNFPQVWKVENRIETGQGG